MAQPQTAIVVGAGIVGGACARALAEAGVKVTLLERDFPGGGATATAMGHITVMDDSPAQFEMTAYSCGLWRELLDSGDLDVEHDPCGTLWLAADEDELPLLEEKGELYATAGAEVEIWSAERLAAEEPQLRPGLRGALKVFDERVVYPPGAARWLVDRAVEAGARLVNGERVEALADHCVTTAAQTWEADVVVHATGAGARELLPELPIEPRRGHLVITDRYPGFCRHQLVELGYLKSAHTMTAHSVAFNVQPRITGQLLIGSSRELVGWDRTLNREILSEMLEKAIGFLPRLTQLHALRCWVGFRPAAPDSLPYIGRWPLAAGHWVAVGHEGLGITMALGTGAVLADAVLSQTPVVDLSPFDPARALEAA